MDNHSTFLYNPFEDTVFPYDMSALSFFDFSTDVIDNIVKTEYDSFLLQVDSRSDATMDLTGAGNAFSTLDYATFVMGELEELKEEANHTISSSSIEPDFATSIASDSPFPRLESPHPSGAPAATSPDCNENGIESHLKFLSEESVFPLDALANFPRRSLI